MFISRENDILKLVIIFFGVTDVLRFFIILLFSFVVKASEHSFKLPVEFKDFITPFIDIDSRSTEDLSLLFAPRIDSIFLNRVDIARESKFIEKFLSLNNIDRTDTYEEFSVRKKTDAFKELNDQAYFNDAFKDLKDQAYFEDNFFFERNKKYWRYPCNGPIFYLLKDLENPEDIFLLFSPNTAFVLFLSLLNNMFFKLFSCLLIVELEAELKKKYFDKVFLVAVDEVSPIHKHGLNKKSFIRIHNFLKMMIERIEYVDDVQQEATC